MGKPPSTKKPPASKAKKPNQELSLPVPAGDAWKGLGVAKADGIVHRLLDRFEPENIVARERAKAERRKIKARSKGEVQIIREEGKLALLDIKERAAAFRLSSQLRQQENIEAVIKHTYTALPPADVIVSTEPVHEDFIHRLFEDCKNIGDPEMQTLWGHILAGEIVRPGSFHPKTLGIVKDLTKNDASLFVQLCRFGFMIDGDLRVLVLDIDSPIYAERGLTFDTLHHLDDLGLIRFSTEFFNADQLPQTVMLSYGKAQFVVSMPEGRKYMLLGAVLLTAAGEQLAPLTNAEPIPDFPDYAIAQWKRSGITVTPVEARLPTG